MKRHESKATNLEEEEAILSRQCLAAASNICVVLHALGQQQG